MTTVWITIAGLALVTAGTKAIAPALAARGERSPRVARVIAMLPPALMAALVVTGTLADGDRLVLDARIVGIGVACLALALRVPMLGALVLAAVSTALVRAL